MNFEKRHDLHAYLYQKKGESYEISSVDAADRGWTNWHCMILLEADVPFFDVEQEKLAEEIRQELHRDAAYLNLNVHQSIFLYEDLACDYVQVANHIFTYLKLRYPVRFHLAVSKRFYGYECLPEVLRRLERWMESKYYHIDDHIFFIEEEELADTVKEVMDARLTQKIIYDVNRKDSGAAWRHYRLLAEKYADSIRFSAVYVKYVFSKVLEALYQDEDFCKNKSLLKDIEAVYGSRNGTEILKVTEKNMESYSEYIKKVESKTASIIEDIVCYVKEHCEELINAEILSEKYALLPGYISFRFRCLTGENLYAYMHRTRMEKADELLHREKLPWNMVAGMVGYQSEAYFYRMYAQFFGAVPDASEEVK